jgi:hypothetical protein
MEKNILTVPIVVNEGKISQSYKMMLFIGIIVIIVLLLMKYTNNDNILGYNINKCVKLGYMKSDNIKKEPSNTSIIAKTIVLYNLSKNIIPVNVIIVIDNDNNMTPINQKNININKSGVEIVFNLNKELMIKQLIIDVDLFSDNISNILTSQIKVFDKNNNITWNNYEPLSIKSRYIELNMINSDIIYPVKSDKLSDKLSDSLSYNITQQESNKENKLNLILEENTW